MEARYTYDNIELAYTIEGEGDTVILLHGWGCDHNIWKATSELLRNQSEMAAITDLHLTKAGPLMDNHLVWAMWVDVKAEGGW